MCSVDTKLVGYMLSTFQNVEPHCGYVMRSLTCCCTDCSPLRASFVRLHKAWLAAPRFHGVHIHAPRNVKQLISPPAQAHPGGHPEIFIQYGPNGPS